MDELHQVHAGVLCRLEGLLGRSVCGRHAPVHAVHVSTACVDRDATTNAFYVSGCWEASQCGLPMPFWFTSPFSSSHLLQACHSKGTQFR